jgi:hypothetical protein
MKYLYKREREVNLWRNCKTMQYSSLYKSPYDNGKVYVGNCFNKQLVIDKVMTDYPGTSQPSDTNIT